MVWTHDEQECVHVNPDPHTTERNMILPKAQVEDYFRDPKRFKALLGQAPEGIAAQLRAAIEAAPKE